MRGKALIHEMVHLHNRITPAYAGKSLPQPKFVGVIKDHPRLCGEKFSHCVTAFGVTGSPPPMRGKDLFPSDPIQKFRITPAYAGKSGVLAVTNAVTRDHPRLCGEKTSGVHSDATSPRITPAYAGKSDV